MYCNHCGNKLDRDKTWKPLKGYDPSMKRYTCPFCHRQLYIVEKVKFRLPTDTA